MLVLMASSISAPLVARADNLCAPAPVGVTGLAGAPDFWEQPAVTAGSADVALPAGYGQQLDDPRWNGAWQQAFATGAGTQAHLRALEDDAGHFLYLSFVVDADPNGARPAEAIFLGLSDGTHGDLAKIVLTGTDPLPALRNAAQAQVGTWWGTQNGGATWLANQNGAGASCTGGPTGPGPLCWVDASVLRVWTGAGTSAGAGSPADTAKIGVAWAVNARIDLTKVGFHLGGTGALARPYRLFTELRVAVPASSPVVFDWPTAASLGFDETGLPVSSVSDWGQASADASVCAGTSITDTSIGLAPVSDGGVPSTTIQYGATNPANTFVVTLAGAGGAGLPPSGTIKARFLTASCNAAGGGVWNDLVPTPAFFSAANTNATISWTCGGTTGTACPAFDAGTQTANQCLFVELATASSQPELFVHDSASRAVTFAPVATSSPDAGVDVAPAHEAGAEVAGGDAAIEAGLDATPAHEAGVDVTSAHEAGVDVTSAHEAGAETSGGDAPIDASPAQGGEDAAGGSATGVDAGSPSTGAAGATGHLDAAADGDAATTTNKAANGGCGCDVSRDRPGSGVACVLLGIALAIQRGRRRRGDAAFAERD